MLELEKSIFEETETLFGILILISRAHTFFTVVKQNKTPWEYLLDTLEPFLVPKLTIFLRPWNQFLEPLVIRLTNLLNLTRFFGEHPYKSLHPADH